MVVVAVVTFLFDSLRGKRSMPLTSQVLHVLKILENHCYKKTQYF